MGRTKDEIDSCRPYLTEQQFITVSQAERIYMYFYIYAYGRERREEEEEKDYDYCGMNRAVRLFFFCVPLFSALCVLLLWSLASHYARQLLLGGLAAFLARSLSFSYVRRDNQRNNPREARTDTIRVIITHTRWPLRREHHFGERSNIHTHAICLARRNDHRL